MILFGKQRIKIKKAMSIPDANPRIGMNELACQCGFDLYPNFMRAVGNVCNITPATDYRKQQEKPTN